jgi:predicted neuraminidase
MKDEELSPEEKSLQAHPHPDGMYPSRIIFSPGAEYHTRSRRWQGIPGIEIADNGRLWATWYTGGDGEGPGNHVVLVTCGPGEEEWSEPVLVVDPGKGRRAFDPCLWHDPLGRLCFFWAQCGDHSYYDGRAGVWMLRAESSTSSSSTPLWMGHKRLFHGIMMNKPTVLSNGDWLLPVAVWKMAGAPVWEDVSPYYGAGIVASTDSGKTWTWRGAATDVPCISFHEHMVVERRDGSLWMLIRTVYGIAQSESHDGGRTWSRGRATEIDGPNSRFFIRRLRSGRLLLVNHYGFTGRSHLTAMLSEDDGKTWAGGLLLDERRAVSYPDGVETKDGIIHIIYDFNRGGRWAEGSDREILMATFTEKDVLAGRCVSPEARLRRIVNKILP